MGNKSNEELIMTRISADNAAFFTELIPDDILERLSLPIVYGVGALIKREDELYHPAGALVFRSHSWEETYIKTEWLYVLEKERKKGVGTALIRELFKAAGNSGIYLINADLPADGSSKELAAFLEGRDFSLSASLADTVTLPLSFFKRNELIAKEGDIPDDLKFLKDISASRIKKGLQVILENLMDKGASELLSTVVAWFDPEISAAVMGDDRSPKALYLMHRCPSGRLQAVFMGGTEEAGPEDFLALLRATYAAAVRLYGEDTPVELIFRSERGMDLMDRLYEEHPVEEVLRAAVYAAQDGSIDDVADDAADDGSYEDEYLMQTVPGMAFIYPRLTQLEEYFAGHGYEAEFVVDDGIPYINVMLNPDVNEVRFFIVPDDEESESFTLMAQGFLILEGKTKKAMQKAYDDRFSDNDVISANLDMDNKKAEFIAGLSCDGAMPDEAMLVSFVETVLK